MALLRSPYPRRLLGALAMPALVGMLLWLGPVDAQDSRPAKPASGPTSRPAGAKPKAPDAGPIAAAQVAARVKASKARLSKSAGGRLVWKAIEAHGGLERWLAAGTVEFDFAYGPAGKPPMLYTRNRVDLWRSRAWQKELGEGADAVFGWDGKDAWIKPGPKALRVPARFWALTPYYFVGIPFVLADPGTAFEVLPDAKLDGIAHDMVKISFTAGTGDAPDDFYVLYLDKTSGAVKAIRYIVSYPAMFPNGGHSPEKLMMYSKLQDVSGLKLCVLMETRQWDAKSGAGEKTREAKAANVSIGGTIPGALFLKPKDAVRDTSLDPKAKSGATKDDKSGD